MAHLSDNANQELAALLRHRRQFIALYGAESRRFSEYLTESDKQARQPQLRQLCRLLIEMTKKLTSIIQTPLRPYEKKRGCRKMAQ
ncbi:MAG TPA: hypothetical protein VNN62_08005 [Methylomirabilota bacterium]|jgi:hypothetical protein|nr:hypothetical protein [Methylomirabilota bacterium]